MGKPDGVYTTEHLSEMGQVMRNIAAYCIDCNKTQFPASHALYLVNAVFKYFPIGFAPVELLMAIFSYYHNKCDKIVIKPDGFEGCFRMLNGFHQFGCRIQQMLILYSKTNFLKETLANRIRNHIRHYWLYINIIRWLDVSEEDPSSTLEKRKCALEELL